MGILAFKTHELSNKELFYFAVWMRHVLNVLFCGDQMMLKVEVIRERRGITAFTGVASVNGEVACEAKLMCARR